MPGRQTPEGGWFYSLLASLAVVVVAAISIYVLTRVWRAQVAQPARDDASADEDGEGTASYLALTPVEILDRRLAAGEITIAEYDELIGVLNRRFAAAAWSGAEQASA